MSEEVSGEQVEDFSKFLIELGGFFIVEDSGEILFNDGDPVTIDIGEESKKVSSYKETSKGDNLMLNIFSDNLVNTAAVDWFYTTKSKQMAILFQMIVSKAILYKSDEIKDSHEYVRMELTSLLKGDKKMLKDFEELEIDDLLYILYKKKQKTAQLQTKIFDKDWMNTKHDKIPAKHWTAFHKVFKHIFKVDDEDEFNETYKFTSSMLSIPQCEAQLRIILMTMQKLEKFFRAFHPDAPDFGLKEFSKHLPNIHKYHGVACWVNGSSTTRAELEKKSNAPVVSMPKEFKSPFASATPSIQVSSPIIDLTPKKQTSFQSPFAQMNTFGGGFGGNRGPQVRSPFGM